MCPLDLRVTAVTWYKASMCHCLMQTSALSVVRPVGYFEQQKNSISSFSFDLFYRFGKVHFEKKFSRSTFKSSVCHIAASCTCCLQTVSLFHAQYCKVKYVCHRFVHCHSYQLHKAGLNHKTEPFQSRSITFSLLIQPKMWRPSWMGKMVLLSCTQTHTNGFITITFNLLHTCIHEN